MRNKKSVSRLLAGLLLGVAAMLASGKGSAQAVNNPLVTLQGKWVWVGNRDKFGLDKACAERWERYEVSADRRQVKNWYIKEENGRLIEQPGRGYTVLYEEGSAVVLYLNQEDRRYGNGDRWVWVALFEGNRDTFFWRIYTLPLSAEDRNFARVRCPN